MKLKYPGQKCQKSYLKIVILLGQKYSEHFDQGFRLEMLVLVANASTITSKG